MAQNGGGGTKINELMESKDYVRIFKEITHNEGVDRGLTD